MEDNHLQMMADKKTLIKRIHTAYIWSENERTTTHSSSLLTVGFFADCHRDSHRISRCKKIIAADHIMSHVKIRAKHFPRRRDKRHRPHHGDKVSPWTKPKQVTALHRMLTQIRRWETETGLSGQFKPVMHLRQITAVDEPARWPVECNQRRRR